MADVLGSGCGVSIGLFFSTASAVPFRCVESRSPLQHTKQAPRNCLKTAGWRDGVDGWNLTTPKSPRLPNRTPPFALRSPMRSLWFGDPIAAGKKSLRVILDQWLARGLISSCDGISRLHCALNDEQHTAHTR
jgi:hypothetical protein